MLNRLIEDVLEDIDHGARVCLIPGKFNVVHPGHLRLFRYAKEICDHLVIAVYADGWSVDTLIPEFDRLEGVRSNIWVDDAFVLRGNIKDAIDHLRPSIVLKGKEHEALVNPEQAALASYGGLLKFAGGNLGLSTSELLQAEDNRYQKFITHAEEYLGRHQISVDALSSEIEAMRGVKSLVIGDLIVDRYVDCEPVGMSAEDPTLVVSPIAERQFIGGAGIVASHASRLGGNASFVSVRGDDDVGLFALTELEKYGVNADVFCDPERPTTNKTRYRARNQTLLRVNDLRDHQLDDHLAKEIQSKILDVLPSVDVVIFSDFSYGFLSATLIGAVIKEAHKRKIVMAGDSQSSSQIGDITKFQNISLLTPTEREARLAIRDGNVGLVGVSQRLRELSGAEYVPITLGGEGVFLHCARSGSESAEDDRIPALNRNPVDVAGAGDAFLVGTALCLATGADIWRAMYMGSIASACQVSRLGNLPVTREELVEQLVR